MTSNALSKNDSFGFAYCTKYKDVEIYTELPRGVHRPSVVSEFFRKTVFDDILKEYGPTPNIEMNIYEVGVGSGINLAILDSLFENINTHGCDINKKIIDFAQYTAPCAHIALSEKDDFFVGVEPKKMDVVFFNPPAFILPTGYNSRGGTDGVECSINFLRECKKKLQEGTLVYIAANGMTNWPALLQVAQELDFNDRKLLEDMRWDVTDLITRNWRWYHDTDNHTHVTCSSGRSLSNFSVHKIII